MLACIGLGALAANGATSPLAYVGSCEWPKQAHSLTRRYGLMLACMGLGALCANGATGPLAALATLLLPPELKSFALSMYEFLSGLLAPSYSVFMGIALQARCRAQDFAAIRLLNQTAPLAALATLLLPPELKSFALSAYEFLSGLLAPSYSVFMGIALQARLLSLGVLPSIMLSSGCTDIVLTYICYIHRHRK